MSEHQSEPQFVDELIGELDPALGRKSSPKQFSMAKSRILIAVLLVATAAIWPDVNAFDLIGPTIKVQTVGKSSSFSGSTRPFEEPLLDALVKVSWPDLTRDQVRSMLDEQESFDFRAHLTTVSNRRASPPPLAPRPSENNSWRPRLTQND